MRAAMVRPDSISTASTSSMCAQLATMPTVRDRTITLVLGYTGLRWGEFIGLTVGAVDFSRRRHHGDDLFLNSAGKPLGGNNWLPHADPGFTLRVCADLFEDDYADLGDRLEPTADAGRF